MSPVKISVALILVFCLGTVFARGIDREGKNKNHTSIQFCNSPHFFNILQIFLPIAVFLRVF